MLAPAVPYLYLYLFRLGIIRSFVVLSGVYLVLCRSFAVFQSFAVFSRTPISHCVSLLILHLEFVMKKTCPSDFYLIAFHFSEIIIFFYSSFDFVCHVTTLTYMQSCTFESTTGNNSNCDATRVLSCSAFYSPQLENATAIFYLK